MMMVTTSHFLFYSTSAQRYYFYAFIVRREWGFTYLGTALEESGGTP